MALKKPAFEQEPTTVGADTAVAETAKVDVSRTVGEKAVNETASAASDTAKAQGAEPAQSSAPDAAAASATASTAIAKASATSVAVADAAARAKQFQREVADMKGASDFAFGNYRVFKANNGEISETNGDKAVLGRWIKGRLLSWDDHFEISPGEEGASSKDFVAYSKDGVKIDSVIGEDLKSWVGKTVAEYSEYLRKEEDFDKTKVRRFIDTALALMATESGDGPIGEVVQVTLAESSIPAFSKYQQNLQDKARCVAMGLPGFTIPDDPFTFYFLREAAAKGNKSWTKLKIVDTLPAKI